MSNIVSLESGSVSVGSLSAGSEIVKRDGRKVSFDKSKIVSAISKALKSTNGDVSISESIADEVIKRVISIENNPKIKTVPTVEDIQDVVEAVLLEKGFVTAARAYIIYRHERRKLREQKMKLLGKSTLDDVDKKLDMNSLRVLESRYLLRDSDNNIIESPKQLFTRVATLVGIGDVMHDDIVFDKSADTDFDVETNWISEAVSYTEKIEKFDNVFHIGKYNLNKYHFEALVRLYCDLAKSGNVRFSFKDLLKEIAAGKFDKYESNIDVYYNLMVDLDFLPNTPTLMNAGAKLGQLSACFVLPMPDDMAGIMKTASDSAMIFKSGGGIGINYSDLRPTGDVVASTSGVASGAVSFMDIIDTVTNVVKQGGKRRGANMGILESWHPDIEKFINAKTTPKVLENFNVSVGVWGDFWNAIIKGTDYSLINKRTGKIVKKVDARNMIDVIAECAWKSAEPGIIFFDNVNKYNPLEKVRGKPIRACNPCGEQFLYDYESCNLGSINLANFVNNGEFDWKRFEKVTRQTTRFLDNVVDVNKYPIPEIDYESKMTRRIGLGIMGIADVLFKLGIKYDSEEGYYFMNRVAETLTYISMDEGVNLSRERGAFGYFEESSYKNGNLPVAGVYETIEEERNFNWNSLIASIMKDGIRNSWSTTIAPTGTLSMLADVSNGVEPTFALVYEKKVTVGDFYYIDRVFEKTIKETGLYSEELLKKIAKNYGSVHGIDEIPEELQRVFVTTMDIHWMDHVFAQAVWQKWISNSISKTINMPNNVTPLDIKLSYLMAHELGLKGVTVYRDGSRHAQVLHITSTEKSQNFKIRPSEYVMNYIVNNIYDKWVREQLYTEIDNAVCSNIVEKEVISSNNSSTIVVESVEKNKDACPNCKISMINNAGCHTCIECGYSSCSVG